MKQGSEDHRRIRWAGVLLVSTTLALAGCKTQQSAARTDQQISTDIQSKIKGESALSSQNIHVAVANGIATLNGTVSDEASRALAANDSATVAGVRTVVNNLTVQPALPTDSAQAVPVPVQSTAVAPEKPRTSDRRPTKRSSSRPDRDGYTQPSAPPVQQASMPEQNTASPAPAPPPQPVVKDITIPAGTVLPVRITETLDTKTAQTNDAFHGALAADLGIQGVIALRRGAPIVGRIVEAREAAHFKGQALLSLELTAIQRGGQNIALTTDPFIKEGAARGKDTAVKAGGGAALGAIIGAIAGGGKGAAIGGLAGGAAGTGVNAATRGQQVVIPTETLINFQLQSPITVRVTIPPPGSEREDQSNDPQLQRH